MSLRVHQLTVCYGNTTALSAVDLVLEPSELMVLLGPSGSGKSTLLRTIAGLESLTGGDIRWSDTPIANMPVHQRGFGLMFQDNQLFPHYSVGRNIEFGLRMQGLARRARVKRVKELLNLVGLSGFAQRRITELSGGEQQRVALARALAPQPRLLLLDEPLSALDRSLRQQLAEDLRRILKVTHTTALLVTHDHNEAFAIADRVGVMFAGRIEQLGSPHEVLYRPANTAVAEFFGYSTTLPGKVTAGVAHCALGTIATPDIPDGPVQLVFRPAALEVSPQGEISATVLKITHYANHNQLTVRLEFADRDFEAISPIGTELSFGAHVQLALRPAGASVLTRL